MNGPMKAIATMATMMLIPGLAHAQIDRDDQAYDPDIDVGARVGVAVPGPTLSDLTDPGASVGLSANYWFHPRVAARANLDYGNLTARDDFAVDVDGLDVQGPDLNLWHYTGGLAFNLVDPEVVTPWTVELDTGIGATTIDAGDMAAFTDVADFTETYFSANAGLQIGYEVVPGMDILGAAQVYWMAIDENDFALFEAADPDFDATDLDNAGWSFPLQAAVKFNLMP